MSSPSDTTESKRPATLGEMIFGQMILLIFGVGLPAIFTAASPLTVTELTREGDAISAHISKRLLFIVPFKRTTISPVETFGNLVVRPSRTRNASITSKGIERSAPTEKSAFLTVEGETGVEKVEVSPVNIGDVQAKVGAFLNDPSQKSLRLVTIANWKFGVFAGGLLSLLTVFYLYLQLSSLARWVGRAK